MIKNIMVITVDGIPKTFFGRSINRDICPYLNKLMYKGYFANNAYSMGPYTEAAVVSYYYGKPTLDDGGYLFQMLDIKGSFFEEAIDTSRKIFHTYYASSMPIELYNSQGYSYNINYANPYFSRFFMGKLSYFKNIYDKNKFNDRDKVTVERILQSFFDIMLPYGDKESKINDYTQNNIFIDTLKRKQFIEQWRKDVYQERDLFYADKNKYIEELFDNYDNHFLINGCYIKEVEYSKSYKEVLEKRNLKPLLKEINKLNTKYFIKRFGELNGDIPYKLLTSSDRMKYLRQICKASYKTDYTKMLNMDSDQVTSSAKHMIEDFLAWERTNNEPYLAYLHFDEFHCPISFLTHEELVDEEIENVREYLDNIDKNYSGNIPFDLAARYLDKCIQYLFEQKPELLRDNYVIITTDHGIATSDGVVRPELNNWFCDETYHIPFLLIGDEVEPQIEQRFINSIDINQIIRSLIKDEKPRLDKYGREFILTEYAGSGVPDIQRREILFGYRSEEISYCIKIELEKEFNEYEVLCYYNLKNDPRERKNLSKSVKMENLVNIHEIEKRFIELKKNYISWISDENDCFLGGYRC